MANRIAQVPYPTNEPILSYAPGSPEKEEVLKMYDALYHDTIEIPMRIGSQDVKLGTLLACTLHMTTTIYLEPITKPIKKILKTQSLLLWKQEKHGVRCLGNLELRSS